MSLPYQIIDAFTSSAFAGNPAAVVLLPSRASGVAPPNDTWHHSIAKEFNIAETAFLTELEDSTPTEPHYLIRWFVPGPGPAASLPDPSASPLALGEFPLCGHASLASAAYLFAERHPAAGRVRFETTTSGPVGAARVAGSDRIELDFPADDQLTDPAPEGWVADDVVKAAEAANPAFIGKVLGWGRGKVLGWVVEVAADVQLEGVPLDAKEFIPLGGYVVFTQAGTNPNGPHIKSRVIVPEEDNLEDPVTGSAHTMAAPYWLGRAETRARLPVAKAGEVFAGDVLQARQVSTRGGDLEVEWVRETGRTKLRGSTVVVMEGKIRAVQ